MSVRPLATYVGAATLARTADAGAAVAVVLLTVDRYPTATAGLLAAALTVPHLLGPVVARRLDAARDGRRVLATACVVYGAAFGSLAWSAGHAPPYVLALQVLLAGTAGPLLTGGLSSRLTPLARPDDRAQGRAQGWDAVTYGIAGTGGPALVALLAGVWSPAAAVRLLGAAALVAAALVLVLPRERQRTTREAFSVRAALALVVRHPVLRRVTALMVAVELVGGGLAVLAVVLGGDRGVSGATLVAAFGLGNLVASVAVTTRPSRRDPESRVLVWVAVAAVGYVACALVSGPVWTLVAFALTGAAKAPYFTATLAVRSQSSPEGARGQVFVTVAGLKTAAGSAGAAIAGTTVALGPATVLATGGLALTAAAAAAAWARSRVPRRSLRPLGGALPGDPRDRAGTDVASVPDRDDDRGQAEDREQDEQRMGAQQGAQPRGRQ